MGGSLLFWLDVIRDFAIVVSLLVWIASIGWVVRDAGDRGVNRFAAALLAIVFPFVGAFLYGLVRPRTRLAEVRERALWLQLAEVSARVPRCPSCSAPVERDYVACPSCAEVLRRRCTGCGAANDFSWVACAYCGEPEDATRWTEREPARATAAVTELKPAKRRRSSAAKAPAKSESAV